MEKLKNKSDIRGAGHLAIDAIRGISDLSEDLHQTIGTLAGLLGSPHHNRTTGLTGLVYHSIRKVSGWAGSGMDILLDHLDSSSEEAGEESASSPKREAILAALNGVLGDHLAASDNPLAIRMQLRQNGSARTLSDPDFIKSLQKSEGKVILMVHGSCLNDLQWERLGHDHGAALARDLGYTPLYLHYNSGLHISENGRALTQLLDQFTQQLPQITELVIIAHSMGGLLSRSACHYAKEKNHEWLQQLSKIIFLATPHHGAPLERGGNGLDILLKISPYSAPFTRLGKIRSAGVTDLRYGNILDEDWEGRDRFALSGDKRTPVALPEGVLSYAIAGSMGKETMTIAGNVLGDGLVMVKSALGQHKNPDLNLQFPKNHQRIIGEINHLDLLNHPKVYQIIKEWVEG